MTRHRHLGCSILAALVLTTGAMGMARAQAWKARVQDRASHVSDQLRKSDLREQQRQRTSDTTRQAFQSRQAQTGIDQADKAQHDRYREQQRNRVEDYLSQPQRAQGAGTSRSAPAHASSTR